MKRIAIVGTIGVGKTELLNALKTKMHDKNMFFIDEAIHCINMRFVSENRSIEDNPHETMFTILQEQLKNERNMMQNQCSAVSDRSLLDLYALFSLRRDIFKGYELELFKELFLANKNNFDTYIYIPKEFNVCLEGVREEVRKAIGEHWDNMILKVLKDNGIKYITITGSISERAEKLSNILRVS